MRLLCILFFAFASYSYSATVKQTISTKVPATKLDFRYQSFDGQINLKCKHQKENEWYDWKVVCGSEGQKEFSVHLKVSKYSRTSAPKTRYEVLYWLTDRSDNFKGTGTTVWFHLNEETSLNKIQLSQSTDGDTAGLYLTVTPY